MEISAKVIHYLINRIDYRINEVDHKGTINHLNEIREKLQNSYVTLNSREKGLLTGIIEEYFFPDNKGQEKFMNWNTFYSQMSDIEKYNLSKEELKKIEELDKINRLYNIISKTKKTKLLKEFMEPLLTIKAALQNQIYYSNSGHDVYKIGASIDEKNYFSVPLRSDTPIGDVDVLSVKNEDPLSHFMNTGTKAEVLGLIKEREKEGKLSGRQYFFKEVLEQE